MCLSSLLYPWCLAQYQEVDAVVQSLSGVRFLATPWTPALQASLSFTASQSLLKQMSIESVMPSSHLIPISSHPLLGSEPGDP